MILYGSSHDYALARVGNLVDIPILSFYSTTFVLRSGLGDRVLICT